MKEKYKLDICIYLESNYLNISMKISYEFKGRKKKGKQILLGKKAESGPSRTCLLCESGSSLGERPDATMWQEAAGRRGTKGDYLATALRREEVILG